MKSLLDKVNNKLDAQGGFFKAVSVLVSGTVLAQIVAFICLPLLTRLYSPEDFSILGIYISIVSIFAVISCLRFDIAIPVADKDKDAKALLKLSLIINGLISFILLLIIYIFLPLIDEYEIIKKISWGIWLIPVGVYLSGSYSALQFWATRNNEFKLIAKSRVSQAISNNILGVILGLISFNFLGLLIGQIFGYFSSILALNSYKVKYQDSLTSSDLIYTFKKFSRFPKYSTGEALFNNSATQLPIIIIASFMIGGEAGYILIAMKVLGIPIGIISSSISQVYLSKAKLYYDEKKLYTYTKSIVLRIFLITFIPFIFLYFIDQKIYSYILGENWGNLKNYISIMIPWYFMQILYSPISMGLHIINFQKIALLMQILGFFIRVVGLIFCIKYYNDITLYYYAFSNFIFYFICFLLTMKLIWLVNSENKV